MNNLETIQTSLEGILSDPQYQIPSLLKARLENLSTNLSKQIDKINLSLYLAEQQTQFLEDALSGERADVTEAIANIYSYIQKGKIDLNGGKDEDF